MIVRSSREVFFSLRTCTRCDVQVQSCFDAHGKFFTIRHQLLSCYQLEIKVVYELCRTHRGFHYSKSHSQANAGSSLEDRILVWIGLYKCPLVKPSLRPESFGVWP